MKLLKGFRFFLTVILLIAVITACAAPSAQPTVEPSETSVNASYIQPGTALITKITYEDNRTTNTLDFENEYKPKAFQMLQKLQTNRLSEQSEEAFRAITLPAAEKDALNNIVSRLVTTLYTTEYAREEDMRKNMDFFIQESYSPELLATAEKQDFVSAWAKRLFNGGVNIKINSMINEGGNQVEALNEGNTLVAVNMRTLLSLTSKNSAVFPTYFEEWNSPVNWMFLPNQTFAYTSSACVLFRVVLEKKNDVWEIYDWESWQHWLSTQKPVNVLEVSPLGISTFSKPNSGLLQLPGSQFITEKKQLSGIFYQGDTQSYGEQTAKELNTMKTLAENLSRLAIGDYTVFSEERFALFSQTASLALKSKLQESKLLETLLKDGKTTNLMIEASPHYGTIVSSISSEEEPLALYNGGLLYLYTTEVMLRQSASPAVRAAYGLPSEEISLWHNQYYFSVINGKISLEAFCFQEYSNNLLMQGRTPEQRWQMGANDG